MTMLNDDLDDLGSLLCVRASATELVWKVCRVSRAGALVSNTHARMRVRTHMDGRLSEGARDRSRLQFMSDQSYAERFVWHTQTKRNARTHVQIHARLSEGVRDSACLQLRQDQST